MSKAKILVVEDDAILATHLEQILGQLNYQAVGLAATGHQAVMQAAVLQPDAILMDIRLRGEMTGIQAAQQIRDKHDIPIIYLTAYSDEPLIHQAKLTDPYAYLTKPVRDHELRASIETALYRHISELRISRLNQVLRAVRDIDKLITHEKDAVLLMNQACHILMRTRGYQMVWIGVHDESCSGIKILASAGSNASILKTITDIEEKQQQALLPSLKALQNKIVTICQDAPHDPRFIPGRNALRELGINSIATLPINHDDILYGILCVYAAQPAAFDSEEVELLDELAGDLGFALYSINQEKARSESEALLHAIFQAMPAALGVVIDRVILKVNDYTCCLTGYSNDELLHHNARMLYPTDEEYEFVGRVKYEQIRKQGFGTVETRWQCKDGRIINILLSSSAIDPHDWSRGIVFSANDITDRKMMEEDMKRLNSELDRRVKERTAQLEAANSEMEAFSFSVSHDLRTPLRAIDGFTQILATDFEPNLNAEGKRICATIHQNTLRMNELIEGLLMLSCLGRSEMKCCKIDMSQLANSVYREITTPQDRGRIDFHVGLLPPANGDPALIRQVWFNLLSNAVKFSSKRQQALIRVHGENNGDEIIYSISDNGAGFSMEFVEKIFAVFQRLHSIEDFQGSGVGLAIVQRVISRHGGRVWAEGKPDRGAVFHFTLLQKESHP